MVRLNDEDLEMSEMVIQMFNSRGAVDVTIEMETAGYNIGNGLLESETETHVSNRQFDLTGNKLIYDTKTQKGKLIGNVKMYIFGAEGRKEEEEEEEEEDARVEPEQVPAEEKEKADEGTTNEEE